MTDLVESSISTHNFVIFFLVVLIVYHYFIVSKSDDYIALAKKLKFTTPLFHSINTFIIYTGAIVSAYAKQFDWTVLLMIGACIFLMVSEIKRYKKMRVILSSEVEKQEEFKLFAKKIYIMQLLTIFGVYVIAKVF